MKSWYPILLALFSLAPAISDADDVPAGFVRVPDDYHITKYDQQAWYWMTARDQNHDGKISLAEHQAWQMRELGHLDHAERDINQMDINDDGILNLVEVREWMRKRDAMVVGNRWR